MVMDKKQEPDGFPERKPTIIPDIGIVYLLFSTGMLS